MLTQTKPTYRMAQASRTGRRSSNQDTAVSARLADGRELLVVADGMGGYNGGEVASRMVTEILVAELESNATLRDAVRAANAAVYEESSRSAEHDGMGTTVVAALRTGSHYEIANVGDSRAYRVDADGITQITRDHSFVHEMADSGALSEEEAGRSPWRHALTRAIGPEAEVEVDEFGPFSTDDDAHILLLSSDGLHKAISAEAIRDTLLSSDDLEAATEALTELALREGSNDNVTVAAMAFGSPVRRNVPAKAVHREGTFRRSKKRRRGPKLETLLFLVALVVLGAWLVWSFSSL